MEAGSLACLGAVRLRSVMAGRGLNDGCCLGTTDDILAAPPAHRFPSPRSPICGRGVSQQATQAVGCVQYGSDEQTTVVERQGPPWCGSYQAEAETHWVGRINQPSALLDVDTPGKRSAAGPF